MGCARTGHVKADTMRTNRSEVSRAGAKRTQVVVVGLTKLPVTTGADAWEGITGDGGRVHIGSQPGRLVVLHRQAGSGEWRMVVDCRPHLIEVEGRVQEWRAAENRRRGWGGLPNGKPLALLSDEEVASHRMKLRLEAEAALRGEFRAWVWRRESASGVERDRSLAGFNRVAAVLRTRERLLPELEALGLAGGATRVVLPNEQVHLEG